MESLLADVTHAARRLVRAPGFAIAAILTLALGIGANTAIFSLVSAVLLQPLPYANPDRLVVVWANPEKGEMTWLAGPEIQDYARESATFENFGAYTVTAANLTGGQEPERVIAAAVTPALFTTLGVAPLVGRAFQPTDSADQIANAVVLSHGLWTRRFGGQRDIIGQTIQVNGTARTVVAVMPESFRLPLDFSDERPSELWVPLNLARYTSWGDHSFIGVGRLRSGVAHAQANATLVAAERRWVTDGNWTNRDLSGRRAFPLKDLVLGDVRYAL